MYLFIVVPGLILTVIYFIWKMYKMEFSIFHVLLNKSFKSKAETIIKPVPFSKNENTNRSDVNTAVALEYKWWRALDNLDQLHLALTLIQKALPVWENYSNTQEIIYKITTRESVTIIEIRLLQKAIDEIILQSQMLLPAFDNKKINQYYCHFVGHVIALQDGNWTPPYQIKKIFLSVYNVLKSIVEQNNPSSLETYLAISINQSLDCMDISKLYTPKEITDILKVYKNKL